MATEFKLRFNENEINDWAEKYNIGDKDRKVNDSHMDALKPEIKKQGFLTKDDLCTVCKWKAPRMI